MGYFFFCLVGFDVEYCFVLFVFDDGGGYGRVLDNRSLRLLYKEIIL